MNNHRVSSKDVFSYLVALMLIIILATGSILMHNKVMKNQASKQEQTYLKETKKEAKHLQSDFKKGKKAIYRITDKGREINPKYSNLILRIYDPYLAVWDEKSGKVYKIYVNEKIYASTTYGDKISVIQSKDNKSVQYDKITGYNVFKQEEMMDSN